MLGWALAVVWRWLRARRAHKALVARRGRRRFRGASSTCSCRTARAATITSTSLPLTSLGILVVDLRDVRGNIFGGDQMSEWTVMDGARRSTFTESPERACMTASLP